MKQYNISYVQAVYNLINTQANVHLLPFCFERNIPVIVKVPLAKGLLSGKYPVGFKFKNHDIRSSFGEDFNANALNQVDFLKTKCPPNLTMCQWALKFCLENRSVISAISGCRNISQLAHNAEVMGYVKHY